MCRTSIAFRNSKRLADKLVEASFADTCFFTNSGTECCELAVKMARKYWFEKDQPERVNIITFEGAFHGRSSAGIAAAGSEKMTKGFGPCCPASCISLGAIMTRWPRPPPAPMSPPS
jgi:acetylornithine/succinyldiaminopimelate/putrescine aminotransferase